MEKVGEHGVRLTFNDKADRELPLLLALLPILPKHATDAENFDKSTLKPLIASGPYRIDSVRPGEVVVLKRNPDYWAKDIPSKRGFDNYDEIRINYYRDENTMFEAFKKGALNIQIETDTGRWATGYNFPAATDGRIAKDTFKSGLPSGMYGFVLNTRRDVFKNRDVRLALGGLFDFEWANKNLFSGAYQRIRSYYDGSVLSSFGTPASDAEKALLQPYADKLLPEVMAGTWTPPASDGSGRDRAFLKKGFDALKKAGYELKDGTMIGPDGKPLAFEILLNGKSGEAVAGAWQRTLEKLGIAVAIRSVDSAQYLQRQRVYDFDAMLMNYTSSLSPGTEQAIQLGLGLARRRRHIQFRRRRRPGDRRDDRASAQGAQPGGFRDRGAGLRPAAAQRRLCRSALFPARPVGGALGTYQTSRRDAYIWLSAADLVARRQSMMQQARTLRRNMTMAARETISVDVVSDVVCPWCFIGQKRLERDRRRHRRHRCRGALAAVPARPDHPARRQGPQALHAGQVRQRGAHRRHMHANVEALGEAVGIDFAFDAIKVSPNTLDAHRVIRWAGTAGEEVQNRLTRCSSSISRKAPISATMRC